jgi:hypothetical protein
MGTSKTNTVTVSGRPYNLQVTIGSSPEEIVSFVFTLFGDDGKQYHVQDVGTKKQAQLIRKLLAKLGAAWPDGSLTVQANPATHIISDVL